MRVDGEGPKWRTGRSDRQKSRRPVTCTSYTRLGTKKPLDNIHGCLLSRAERVGDGQNPTRVVLEAFQRAADSDSRARIAMMPNNNKLAQRVI